MTTRTIIILAYVVINRAIKTRIL